MKLKHKELVLGILIGAIVFGTIGTLADNLYNIMPNPFKIKVNGVEKNIEGYNINGYSYFKLRDIGEQIGFKVDFKEDTILINSNNKENSNNVDTSYNYITINGIEYISSQEVSDVVDISTKGKWAFAYSNNENGVWTNEHGSWCYLCKRDANYRVVEEYEITCEFIDGISYITRETFENDVLKKLTGLDN